MDGAFIGNHNTKEISWFEYISLKTIKRRVFGNMIRLIVYLFDRITEDFSDSNRLKIILFANKWNNCLEAYVEVLHPDSYNDVNKMPFKEVIDYFYFGKKRTTCCLQI